jgi:hypothetical protein
MAVKFLGWEIDGELVREPPEWVDKQILQAFAEVAEEVAREKEQGKMI